jgi:hypothetical protein
MTGAVRTEDAIRRGDGTMDIRSPGGAAAQGRASDYSSQFETVNVADLVKAPITH